jgi:P pilus assembly chaperone PapD
MRPAGLWFRSVDAAASPCRGGRCLARTVLAVVTLSSGAAAAQVGADLNISPKRIVEEPAGRTATAYIFNRGTVPATYSISLVDRLMTADGQIRSTDELAKAPGGPGLASKLRSAAPMIVYTPRRVTLGPGESQTVRLRILRPANLASGEYRTHLTVTAVPPETLGLTAEEAAAPGVGELAVKVVSLFSLSIPVIVRQGPTDVRAAIEAPKLGTRTVEAAPGVATQGGQAFVSLDLVRQGASSLYGDIEIRPVVAGKPGAVIGGVRGVAVYPEIDRRTVSAPLTAAPASGETLMVTFRDEDAHPGVVPATATILVP